MAKVYNIDEAIDRFPRRRACYNCLGLHEVGQWIVEGILMRAGKPYIRHFSCSKGHFDDVLERQICANMMPVLAPRCPDYDSSVE